MLNVRASIGGHPAGNVGAYSSCLLLSSELDLADGMDIEAIVIPLEFGASNAESQLKEGSLTPMTRLASSLIARLETHQRSTGKASESSAPLLSESRTLANCNVLHDLNHIKLAGYSSATRPV